MADSPAQPEQVAEASGSARPVDDEVNLLDLLIVLAKHKKLVLGLPGLAAVTAVVVALLLPDVYTASTRILPPQQSQSTSALLSQLSGLAGLAGGPLPGIRNPNDLYVGMLKSRTVADNIILRFELDKVYEEKLQSGTRKRLESLTSVVAGKDGIIGVEVDDKDPERAAGLANAYVEELFKLTTVLAVTEASQRRLFFERQMRQAKDNLVSAEVAAKSAMEQGGLVAVEAQGRTALEAVARLRAQISVKEVQIGAMRMFAAEGNPELKRTQQEMEVMKRELARSEGVTGNSPAETASVKSSGIDSLGLLRNVKYYETMYELLAKQYESAKLDEVRDSAIIQVIDKAIKPDRKSKPKRALIVILAALAAGFLAVLWAFLREAAEWLNAEPLQAERLTRLKSHLGIKRRA